MKRLVVSTAIIVLTVLSGVTSARSLCYRCYSQYIIGVGMQYGCCRDSENPEILDNCIYAGQNGNNVGDRFLPCNASIQGCNGTPCSPTDDESPGPIMVALDGNRPHLSSPEQGVVTDLGRRGVVVRAGWPTHAADGWLMMDRSGKGVIGSVRDMFSEATRLSSGKRARNGYEALAELDGNRDGAISIADSAWGRLSLWFDRNHNGRVDPEELVSLARAGIVTISTHAVVESSLDEHANRTLMRAAVLMTTGHQRASYTVSPAQRQLPGLQSGWYAGTCGAN